MAFLISCLSSCVTKTINIDGSASNKVLDKEKLSNTYADLALEYLNHSALTLALERVDLAITVNVDNYRAYMIRGIIYQNLNKPTEAIKSFKKSLELNSGYSDTYVNYGNFLCSINDYDEAFNNFDKAITNPAYLSPEIAYYNRGKCYFQQGSFESANKDLLQSIQYKHIPENSYVLLSELNYKQHNYTLAKFYIDQFSGVQTSESLWVHIQILNALISQNNKPSENKKYYSYENLLSQMLLNDFKNSPEAHQYIMLYGEK